MLCKNCRMFEDVRCFDDLCEFAINFLLSGQGDARALVVQLAERMQQKSPLELIFLLSIAAAGIEETFGGEKMAVFALDTWRIAALLGVDLHMMELRKINSATCADMLKYWQDVDGYFLRG